MVREEPPALQKQDTKESTTHYVSVVIVAYNDAAGVEACLTSIKKHESKTASAEIVVIDNSSTTEVREMVLRKHADIQYVSNPNVGYGAGNNRGMSLTSGDIVAFLNPDTYLTESLFEGITQAFSRNCQLGAIGVKLFDPSGAAQQSFFWVDGGGLFKSLAQHVLTRTGIFLESRMCTSGAALFVRRSAFNAAGGFDQNIFLYCEEPDLWRRMTAKGWRWGYTSHSKLTHVGGGTIPNTHFATAARLTSLKYYCNKHGLSYTARLQKELRHLRCTAYARRLLLRSDPSRKAQDLSVIDTYKKILTAADPSAKRIAPK